MRESMLTTVDNPFDPFNQFDDWLNYDLTNGYDSCGLIARFEDVSVIGNADDPKDALTRIVELFPETYKIVSKNSD